MFKLWNMLFPLSFAEGDLPAGGDGKPDGSAPPASGGDSGTPDPQSGDAGHTPGQNQDGGSGDGDKKVPLAALHEAREEIKALKTQMDQLKSMVPGVYYDAQGNPVSVQPPNATNPVTPPAQTLQAEMDQAFEMGDYKRAVALQLRAYHDWSESTRNSVDDQIDSLLQEQPDAAKYLPQMRKYLRTIPLEQRSAAGTAKLAYFVVKGQNVDKVVAEAQKQWEQKLNGGLAAQGVSAGAGLASGTGPRSFTKDEIAIAANYGMKPEEYWNRK